MSKYIFFGSIKTFIILLIVTFISGCNLPTASNHSLAISEQLSSKDQVTITFTVHLEKPIPAGDSLFVSILDEVTGLAFNPQKHIMSAENSVTYSVSLPFSAGSVIKYRYSREGTAFTDEVTFTGRPVRYRLYHVEGNANIDDIAYRWADTKYQGKTGRILGQVLDKTTGEQIPDILITAGGEQVFSHADGSFLIEGLPPGTHNLDFYAIDGTYAIYQQGAVVAEDSTTPVTVQLTSPQNVNVIFTVTVPVDTPADAPIRMAGNLYQLGNTYADLAGGANTLAAKMPLLGKLSDGRYMVTLNLPSGTYLEYKYTLGDGLWSSELKRDGSLFIRKLIIPSTNLEINDSIETWRKSDAQSIIFELNVPSNTPNEESIFIQFNPGFGWLEPLPMWPAINTQGQKIWKFDLTGPFNHSSNLRYRYCRQGQCGIADDEATMGINPAGRTVNTGSHPGVISDEIKNWAWFSSPNKPVNVPDVQTNARGADFMAGISFQANYNPSWSSNIFRTVEKVRNLNVNWLILNPTWTFINSNPPLLEPLPSQDMLSPDLVSTIKIAQQQGLQVGLYPVPHFPTQVDFWWQNSSRNLNWWISFFEQYSNFILHHAIIASKTGAGTLLLGGDWLNPALPGGLLADSSGTNVVPDTEIQWRSLIQKIRLQYSGKIGWVLSYPGGVKNPPPFLDAIDQVYIVWSAPLATQPHTSYEEMKVEANKILNQDILPFQQQIVKPFIIAISYPSVEVGAMGCIQILGGGCLDYNLLYPPNTDITALVLDLDVQANAYNAMLAAINENNWLSGFVSMGYYPPVAVQDKSISINGKPASGVVWYWSQKFLGR